MDGKRGAMGNREDRQGLREENMTSAKWGRKLKNKNVNKQTDEQVLDYSYTQ